MGGQYMFIFPMSCIIYGIVLWYQLKEFFKCLALLCFKFIIHLKLNLNIMFI